MKELLQKLIEIVKAKNKADGVIAAKRIIEQVEIAKSEELSDDELDVLGLTFIEGLYITLKGL